MVRIVLLIFIYSSIYFSFAQSIPLGFNSVDTYLRREQLEGKFDSTVSFTYRSINYLHSFDTLIRVSNSTINSTLPLFSNNLLGLQIHLLPFFTRTEINTNYPYGGNNGILLKSRGIQQLISGGVNFKYNFLSFVFRPEIGFSQNKLYEGLSENFSKQTWQKYYFHKLNRIDFPQQNGNQNRFLVHPGQSGLYLNLGFSRFGISTENIWTGPAIHSPLIFSNNAPGFFHFKFDTNTPLNVGIGNLEFLLAVGNLKSSNTSPIKHDSTNLNFFRPYVNQFNRIISIVHLAYSPKFIKGFTIGATRSVQSYEDKLGFDYFDSFTGFFRSDGVFDRADQIASVFSRYQLSKARAEFYIEWGRNDAAWNLRNLLTHPEHSRAYTFGAIKNFNLNQTKWELKIERSVLERSGVFIFDTPEPIFYLNTGLRHGHTNQGELLGSWTGGGSTSTFIELNHFNKLNTLGLFFSYISYERDIQTLLFEQNVNDQNWNEISWGIQGNKLFEYVLVNCNLIYNRSINYYWKTRLNNENVNFPNLYTKKNLHFSLSVIYLFRKTR